MAVVGPLTGFTIGVTACRRADEQIELLERKGATTLHGPAIETRPLVAGSALAAATRALVDKPPDITLLSTGIGVRAWFEAAATLDLTERLVDALTPSTVMARGPKAHGAAVTVGLGVDWHANGRASELVDRLREIGAEGRRVAVQLDGASGTPLADAVADLGADVVPVPVYEWTMPSDTGPALRLVEAVIDRRVDGITFTARPQVDNLATIAADAGLLDEFLDAARPIVIACVGPVCAEPVFDLGLPSPVQPERYRLGSMVMAVVNAFQTRARELPAEHGTLRLQGRALLGSGDGPILLTDRERLVLDVLAERPGRVWSKEQLLDRVWVGTESDPHVVEVTVARLRRRLGDAGVTVETVMRRGYRIAVDHELLTAAPAAL